MPMYEYRCKSCNYQFELLQKFSAPPAEECPKCGGKVEKLISQTAFSLKGDGWFNSSHSSSSPSSSAPVCSSGG